MLTAAVLRRRTFAVLVALAAPVATVRAQDAELPAGPAGDAVREGRKLASQGKLDDALKEFMKAMSADGKLFEAHLATGTTLDLLVRYGDARKHLAVAIDLATPEQKGSALRNMAFSYGFEQDCPNAVKYSRQAYDLEVAKPDFEGAAGVANELGRVCLESGDTKTAQEWYKTGYDAAMKQPVLSDSAKDLWNFRWHNALARIAARKGDKAAAMMHVGHAKGFLDKGTNPGQLPFLPYLTGYVAFYTGDMTTAIADLRKAQQGDPLNLAVLALAYEKNGDNATAMELWKKIMTITNHNPTNAFARPLARKKIG